MKVSPFLSVYDLVNSWYAAGVYAMLGYWQKTCCPPMKSKCIFLLSPLTLRRRKKMRCVLPAGLQDMKLISICWQMENWCWCPDTCPGTLQLHCEAWSHPLLYPCARKTPELQALQREKSTFTGQIQSAGSARTSAWPESITAFWNAMKECPDAIWCSNDVILMV